jgi:hypothetical protein
VRHIRRAPGVIPPSPCDGADTQHVHEWFVFSTALKEVALMLECALCGAFGTVDDPTRDEWAQAADASEHPYRWRDESRVTVRGGPQPQTEEP